MTSSGFHYYHFKLRKLIQILLVDTIEEDYILLKGLFNDIPNKKYSVDWVATYQEGIKEVARGKHDVYLVDYQLGLNEEKGLDLVRNSISAGSRAPFIILAGSHSAEIDEAAMNSGALDFLVKSDLTSHELESSIRYSINHAKNIEEIKSLNTDLERRVEERTDGLRQALKDLEFSKKETEKALKKEKILNEHKSRFVTMASHEFRTPLSTILSSANLISKYTDAISQEKRQKHIDRIRTSVHDLTDILEDFLSLGKLEEGAISAQPELFNLNDLCNQVVSQMESLIGTEREIIYEYSGLSNDVFLDPKLFKNILINLLSNAVKFSAEGKPIHFATEFKKNGLVIRVIDHGIGIPESEQLHMFERFFRASNVTNIQGTGLGLNIVKKYVEMMKGELSFSSKIGEGTTFTLKLPVKI